MDKGLIIIMTKLNIESGLIYLGLERVYINKTKKISFFLAELKKIVWNNKYINNVTYFKTISMLPKMKENMQIWDSECGYNK